MKQFLTACCFCAALGTQAQQLHYEFSAPNAAHHEAEISLTAADIPPGPAVFRMSRSSPGRYATHEFGKNIYNVHFTDKNGQPLPYTKTSGDVYEVKQHKGWIKAAYTLYANYADGTYAGIDETGYHLNMPATFLWLKGYDATPITLHFTVPNPAWTIATQLPPAKEPNTFTAPGLQYFMDAPVKIGNLKYTEWQVNNPGGAAYRFRIALDGQDSAAVLENFGQKVQRIVQQAQAVFGETPAYDYGSYTFLASINPYVKGDGMEHRNSTMISIPTVFHGEDFLLEVFSHEFFHCWNVERIRPRTIEPFNFEKSNVCDGLWLAEGFTQYYGELLMVRAGFTQPEAYCKTLAALINAKQNTPGGQLYSPIENSQRAVFADAGVSIDKTNYPNMFTTYYYYGGAVALALDLELRSRFHKTLDDFMRGLWKKFGKTEIPYTMEGLQQVLAETTGDAAYAAGFFRQYIYGHELFDYSSLLTYAGITLQPAYAGKAWMGNVQYTVNDNRQLMVNSNTVRSTPLYEAGVDVNDCIISMEGNPVQQKNELDKILDAHKPGDVVSLIYQHRGEQKQTTVSLKQNPSYQVVLNEKISGNISPIQQQFRDAWLGKTH